MPISRSSGGWGPPASVPVEPPPAGPTSALNFPLNYTSNSDIRLVWNGANLLSRTDFTIIRKVCWIQQLGYYAWGWHSRFTNDGNFDGNWCLAAQPYPSTSAVDGSGASTGGTGGSGSVHHHEIASLGFKDYIASPGGSAILVVKGTALSPVWFTQAYKCELIGGTTLRHTFYVDLDNPSQTIIQDWPLASAGSPAPSTDVFYIGASDWRRGQGGAGADSTDESPGCLSRFHKFFSAALSLVDIQAEVALEANVPVSTAGIASVHYMNINPTVADVTDKSGAGHSPTWHNSNRPADWTP